MLELPFAIKKQSTQLLEPESNRKGLVIRYSKCNLRCPLCFAQSYAYLNETTSRRDVLISLNEMSNRIGGETRKLDLSGLQWYRIEGGEPLATSLHSGFTNLIVRSFLEKNKDKNRTQRVIIQTNGKWLGSSFENARKFYDGLASTLNSVDGKNRVVIELSFKGPNEKACDVYSHTKGSFLLQYRAFGNSIKALRKHWDERVEIVIYPLAGFGPSFDDLVLIPLDPGTCGEETEVPLFHRSTWSPEFAEVFGLFRDLKREHDEIYRGNQWNQEEKLHMYGLELRGRKFQISWLSRAVKCKWLKDFVEKNLRLNRNNLYHAKLFIRYLEQLKLVPVSATTFSLMEEMMVDFSQLEPRAHYPYL